MLIEVLSKATRRTDQVLKRQRYLALPSLQEYALVEQDFVDIEVANREDNWRSRSLSGLGVRSEAVGN